MRDKYIPLLLGLNSVLTQIVIFNYMTKLLKKTNEITLISDRKNNHQFNVYPNPIINLVNICRNVNSGKSFKINLTDSMGNLIKTVFMPSDQICTTIDLTGCPVGIYFINIDKSFYYKLMKK